MQQVRATSPKIASRARTCRPATTAASRATSHAAAPKPVAVAAAVAEASPTRRATIASGQVISREIARKAARYVICATNRAT